jgi:hypothetical protein
LRCDLRGWIAQNGPLGQDGLFGGASGQNHQHQPCQNASYHSPLAPSTKPAFWPHHNLPTLSDAGGFFDNGDTKGVWHSLDALS